MSPSMTRLHLMAPTNFPDGRKVTIENGVITNIAEPASEDAQNEDLAAANAVSKLWKIS